MTWRHRAAARAVAYAVVVALGMSACAASTSSAGKRIRIGVKFDQPGLGLRTGSRYSGLDIAVATYVAERLGHRDSDIQWVQAPSSQRETLLTTGQVDLVIATYSITDKRKDRGVEFAGPYFVAGQDLLVRADDTSITGPDSLTGKALCSATGSTSAQYIKDRYSGVQLQELNTYSECVKALLDKTVDAVTTDDAILAGYAALPQYAGLLKVVGHPFTQERYGVGMRRGNKKLCDKVDAALALMVSSGAWKRAVEANLGPSGFVPNPATNPPKLDPCV